MLRRFLLVAALLWSVPVHAQTTTFSTDCNAAITVSGAGLILTADSTNAQKGCRANTPKYSGLWYFEATVGAVPNNLSIGVANNGASVPSSGGWSLSPGAALGQDMTSIGIRQTNGNVFWENVSTSGTSCPLANGKTVGVALNLDTGPHQVWMTCDVANLVCNGSGTSGTTAPMWNNTCASDPSLAGSGRPSWGGTGFIPPTTAVPGTTAGPFLPSYAHFPAFDGAISDKATFNFGGSAFIGTVPSGYSAWNTSGGGAPAALNIQIANAPGYQISHSYAAGSRVVAGPGWTPGSPGNFTNGQNLFLWALSGAGGTSGGSQPAGFSACASPAGVGGGLNGTPPAGWTGATSVSDNGLIWVCLTQVDYTTETGAFLDDATQWTSGGAYYWFQVVNHGGYAYMNVDFNGTAPSTYPYQLIAGATAPTCQTVGCASNDGTINWIGLGPIQYTSALHRWPHMLGNQQDQIAEVQYNYPVNITLWYGGINRQTYLVGSNGEASPILQSLHDDFRLDQSHTCYAAFLKTPYYFDTTPDGYGVYDCLGFMQWPKWTMAPAPGDGFRDNVTPQAGPLRIDSTKGVTLENDNAPFTPTGSIFQSVGEVIGVSDSNGVYVGFQMKSLHGPVFATRGDGPGFGHTNNNELNQNIIDCGPEGWGCLGTDAAWNIHNNAIIDRSTTAGHWVVFIQYPGTVNYNTVIGANATNGTFLQLRSCGAGMFMCTTETPVPSGPLFPTTFNGNAVFGEPNFMATANVSPSAWGSLIAAANNATDISSSWSGSDFTNPQGNVFHPLAPQGVSLTGCNGGGSCYSLSAASQFVQPSLASPLDLRVLSVAADVYSAGANFSVSTNGSTYDVLTPGADVLNTARPVSGRYDIGAEMFIAASGSIGGGRVRR